jgi:hypothetical protein
MTKLRTCVALAALMIAGPAMAQSGEGGYVSPLPPHRLESGRQPVPQGADLCTLGGSSGRPVTAKQIAACRAWFARERVK